MKNLVTLAALLTMLVWSGGAEVQAGSVTFTKIADTNTPIPGGLGNFTTFPGVPSIDDGAVAFVGFGSGDQRAVYIADGGFLDVVADTTSPIPGGAGRFFFSFGNPSINEGNVAFLGDGGDNFEGIYTDLGGTINLVADRNTPSPDGSGILGSFGNLPSLDSGNVAFSSTFQRGIYTDLSGPLTVVANKDTPIPDAAGTFFSDFGNPSIDDGDIAFLGFGTGGIYTDIGGVLDVVADKSTPVPGGAGTFAGFGNPSIDWGNVAFWAMPQGIYSDLGGTLHAVANQSTPIPDGAGTFAGFPGTYPSIDNGAVAFPGFGGGFQFGFYIGLVGTVEKVIDLTDMLDGKNLLNNTFAFFSREGLSGNSITFKANFTDGSQGIFIACLVSAEPINKLIDDVTDLALPKGVENPLLNQLNAALNKISDDNPNNDSAAASNIGAFSRILEAKSGKQISEEDAALLISGSEIAIEFVTCD